MSVIVNYLLISRDYKTFYILRETPACLVSSCLVDRNSRELAAFRFCCCCCCCCCCYEQYVWWQYTLLMATHGNWPRWGCERAKPGWGGSDIIHKQLFISSQLLFLFYFLSVGWKAFGKLDHSQTAFYLISIHEVRYKWNIRSNLLLQKVVFGATDENLTERRVTSQVIPMAIRAFAFVRYDNEATGNTTARNLEY